MINRKQYERTLELLNNHSQKTVCVEANCPNRYECFGNKIATFLMMGPQCTRNCKYCDIVPGRPKPLNNQEIDSILEVVKNLELKYVVITSVNRDDLPDGGASQFVKIIGELKKLNCQVEVLIPDFNGNDDALKAVLDAKPDVLNHNLELVKELFPELRPQGDYDQSLRLLKLAKEYSPNQITKSGLMVGFGETNEQIFTTIGDLHDVDVDYLTIGQYLQPSKDHFAIKKNYSKEEFKNFKNKAKELGFKQVQSGRFVRSSYHAREMADN